MASLVDTGVDGLITDRSDIAHKLQADKRCVDALTVPTGIPPSKLGWRNQPRRS
jgi:hypothetical protein